MHETMREIACLLRPSRSQWRIVGLRRSSRHILLVALELLRGKLQSRTILLDIIVVASLGLFQNPATIATSSAPSIAYRNAA